MQKYIIGFAAVAFAGPKIDPVIAEAIYPGGLEIPYAYAKGKGVNGKKGGVALYEPLMTRSGGPLAVAAAPVTPVVNTRRYQTEVVRTPYTNRYPYELVRPVEVEVAQRIEYPLPTPFVTREFYGYPQYETVSVRGAPYPYSRAFLEAEAEETAEGQAPARKLSEKEVDATLPLINAQFGAGPVVAGPFGPGPFGPGPYGPGPYFPGPIARPYPPFIGAPYIW